jgi:type I restriction enzyme S subunit
MAHYKMSDVVTEVNERENNPANSKYDRFVGLEHYVSGEVIIRNYGSTERLESTMKVFQAGDILVARRNVYLKRASTVDFDGLTSGDSIVLRAKDPEIGRILPFVLNTDAFWDFADQYSDGTMSKRLSPKTLMTFEFDLPDGDELSKLADILWAANDTRESYQALLKQADELVKSQFIELFGDPETNPKEWNRCCLKDVMSAPASNGFFAKPADYTDDGNAGIICVGDVVNRKYSNIEQLRRANADDKQFKKFRVKYGDMLFCRSSLVKEGIAKASIIPQACPEDLLFECHVIRIPLDLDKVIPEFMQAFSVTDYFRGQMMDKSKTATMTTIGQKDVITGVIYVPPLDMQKQFVAFSQQSDKSKLALLNSLAEFSVIKI